MEVIQVGSVLDAIKRFSCKNSKNRNLAYNLGMVLKGSRMLLLVIFVIIANFDELFGNKMVFAGSVYYAVLFKLIKTTQFISSVKKA